MARDLAKLSGRTGMTCDWLLFQAVAMGEHPSACCMCILVVTAGWCTVFWSTPNELRSTPSNRPRQASSFKPFQILVNMAPEADGTTTWSGTRQPSCSATS